MEMKLEVVIVPVSDVESAKSFYSDKCGFVVDHDTEPNENVRIVQLTPPGSGCSIVISKGINTMPPGILQGLQLVVADVEAVRTELADKGVDVTPVRHVDTQTGDWSDGHGGPWNSFIFFSDPDGNGWTIQEKPA
jgi:catechol 2,3-dioxygenase-like lactoylglutathione lyase family enzyme